MFKYTGLVKLLIPLGLLLVSIGLACNSEDKILEKLFTALALILIFLLNMQLDLPTNAAQNPQKR